jgi:hypothetical protein
MKKLLTEWRKFLKEGTGGTFYHLSPIKFDKFQQQMATNPAVSSDVGFHFGTKDTALTVADKLKKDGKVKSGDSVYLYTVKLGINKTMELPENRSGTWGVNSTLKAMFEGFDGEHHPAIPDEMVDEYYDDVVTSPSGENIKDLSFQPVEEMEEFIDWFSSLGFDSIKYENTFEGGGDSYIVFKSDQIDIVDTKEYQVP